MAGDLARQMLREQGLGADIAGRIARRLIEVMTAPPLASN